MAYVEILHEEHLDNNETPKDVNTNLTNQTINNLVEFLTHDE